MADSLQEREADLGRAKDDLEHGFRNAPPELRTANEQLLREVEDRHLAEEQATWYGAAIPAVEQGQ